MLIPILLLTMLPTYLFNEISDASLLDESSFQNDMGDLVISVADIFNDVYISSDAYSEAESLAVSWIEDFEDLYGEDNCDISYIITPGADGCVIDSAAFTDFISTYHALISVSEEGDPLYGIMFDDEAYEDYLEERDEIQSTFANAISTITDTISNVTTTVTGALETARTTVASAISTATTAVQGVVADDPLLTALVEVAGALLKTASNIVFVTLELSTYVVGGVLSTAAVVVGNVAELAVLRGQKIMYQTMNTLMELRYKNIFEQTVKNYAASGNMFVISDVKESVESTVTTEVEEITEEELNAAEEKYLSAKEDYHTAFDRWSSLSGSTEEGDNLFLQLNQAKSVYRAASDEYEALKTAYDEGGIYTESTHYSGYVTVTISIDTSNYLDEYITEMAEIRYEDAVLESSENGTALETSVYEEKAALQELIEDEAEYVSAEYGDFITESLGDIVNTQREAQGLTTLDNVNATTIVEVASQYIGYSASDLMALGMSNDGSWCSEFVAFCAELSGYVDLGVFPANVTTSRYLYNYACSNGTFISKSTAEPKAGMVIIFYTGNDYHSGIIESYDPSTGTINTIEGNVVGYGDSTPRVYRATRSVSDSTLIGYMLIDIDESEGDGQETSTVTETEDH